MKPTRRWMSIREDLRPFGLRSPAQVTPVSSASGLAVSQLTFFDCTDTLYVLCQLVNTQCRGNFSPTSIHPSRNVYSEWRDLVISMRPVRAVTRSSRDDRAHQQRCAGKAGKGQRPKPHEINEFRPYPLFQLFQTHYEFVAGGHSRVPVAVTEPLLSPGNHLSLNRPDSVLTPVRSARPTAGVQLDIFQSWFRSGPGLQSPPPQPRATGRLGISSQFRGAANPSSEKEILCMNIGSAPQAPGLELAYTMGSTAHFQRTAWWSLFMIVRNSRPERRAHLICCSGAALLTTDLARGGCQPW